MLLCRTQERKLNGGASAGSEVEALEEEVQVLRLEYQRMSATLKLAESALAEAEATRQAQLQGVARGRSSHMLDSWGGKVMLVLNVILALALFLVARNTAYSGNSGRRLPKPRLHTA